MKMNLIDIMMFKTEKMQAKMISVRRTLIRKNKNSTT
ncbi:unnamed protein product [Linum tenue]|uniref:Uncharacterized protein n=1 Tax=Linum tenue TaxID=586396 RepID=A0AAV0NDD0_9ROSI|nr:unnamed protein product [Linum tenue]CAI0456386.1 unnamed protein product [Linum tenue]